MVGMNRSWGTTIAVRCLVIAAWTATARNICRSRC